MLAEPILERRVTKLEELMADLIAAQKRTDQQLNRTDQQIESTEQQVNRTSREMRDFKEEMRQSRIEMRRQWGELSNKLGTMVDIPFAGGDQLQQVGGTGKRAGDSDGLTRFDDQFSQGQGLAF